jgi:formylglycine-generating enzyme required for sulfatase activity
MNKNVEFITGRVVHPRPIFLVGRTIIAASVLCVAGLLRASDVVSGPGAKIETRTVPGIDITLVKVKAGSFVMGHPEGYPGSSGDERPARKVTLSEYWLGATAVTVGQFRYFVEATGHVTDAEFRNSGLYAKNAEPRVKGLSWKNPGIANYTQTDKHPVFGASWEDAMTFCAWLNDREKKAGRLPDGFIYRLPTEAQWEYAARYGTTDDIAEPLEYAWYGANSGGVPHPVGTKKPNPWGLYDLRGNGWSWVYDWYGRYPDHDETDPQGPLYPNSREIIRPLHEKRGSSWTANDPHNLMTTNRWSTWGLDPTNWCTFRIALTTVPPLPKDYIPGALAAPTPPAGAGANTKGGGAPSKAGKK